MKLFFWNDPYPVSYGSSSVFVVAETVEQARELAKTGKHYSYGEYLNEERSMSSIELGAPTRVVDLPCAEWHEWHEWSE